MSDTARRAFVSTVVAVAVIAISLALWKLKLVIALVFLGFILAAAMRPGVDRLARYRIPRPAGVALHYLVVVAALGLLLWLAVPRAIDQVDQAIGGLPTSQQELDQKAKHSKGIKHQFFVGLQKRLNKLPSAGASCTGASRSAERPRGDRRHLLRLRDRRVLGLRARQGDRLRQLALTAQATAARPRHLGADRRQAGRVRPRDAAAGRLRGDGALAGVLGDRRALLAPARRLRGVVEIVPVIGRCSPQSCRSGSA
jgi:hypothetical protein